MTSLDQWGAPHSAEEEAEESYFVSMTDIMVGLLFIFIIMLMAFALMLKDAEEELKREEQQTQRTREEILDTVQAERSEADMRRNRRIDLRFVMNLSYEAALQRVEQRLNSVLQQR